MLTKTIRADKCKILEVQDTGEVRCAVTQKFRSDPANHFRSAQRLPDDSLPFFRSGLADVAQVYFVMFAA